MIEIKDLCYKNILKDINLTLNNNKFIGVIGPNGSGKSTLVKAICGQIVPNEGYVSINNKNVDKMTLKEKAVTLSLLAQSSSENLNFKVIDIVLMGLYASRKSLFSYTKSEIEYAMACIEKVGIKDLAHRSFSTLSGGERQRALIARAICQNVNILILDEPLNHLDIYYQLQIMKLVKSFGITVICVLHDFIMALKFCEELIIMKDGKVHETGAVKELINSQMLKDVFNIDATISFEGDKFGILY